LAASPPAGLSSWLFLSTGVTILGCIADITA
jgi:hypothetical protein